jgi:hypothetical protein
MILKFSGLQFDFSPQIRLEGKVEVFNAELPRLHAYRAVIIYVRRMRI